MSNPNNQLAKAAGEAINAIDLYFDDDLEHTTDSMPMNLVAKALLGRLPLGVKKLEMGSNIDYLDSAMRRLRAALDDAHLAEIQPYESADRRS